MQFQMSVFYHNYYISYLITTDDKISFHFQVKSVPTPDVYAPNNFIVIHKDDKWIFNTSLDEEFKKSVVKTLKKTRL